ncbi:MAG: hypothetical protein D6696_15915 [Acidobacteria bacterium]|nr:MAG: hypothetical protein D6696_15915 [Acidobacteriota bacterium]
MSKMNGVLIALSLIVASVSFALALENRSLRTKLADAIDEAKKTYILEPGMTVAPLRGRDIYSTKVEYPYGKDAGTTLVLVFSPTCGVCDDNWPKWRRLIENAPNRGVRIIAIDLSSSADPSYLEKQGLVPGIPVIGELDPALIVSYRLRLVPETLLVDESGTVQRVWLGELDEAAVAEIERVMSLAAIAAA